jgi:hypothetical protein
MRLPPLFCKFFAFVRPTDLCGGPAGAFRLRPPSGVDKENPAIAAAAVGRTIGQGKSLFAAFGPAGSVRLWPKPRGKQ